MSVVGSCNNCDTKFELTESTVYIAKGEDCVTIQCPRCELYKEVEVE